MKKTHSALVTAFRTLTAIATVLTLHACALSGSTPVGLTASNQDRKAAGTVEGRGKALSKEMQSFYSGYLKRASDNEDVSSIVWKYIAKGSSHKEAEAILVAAGFTLTTFQGTGISHQNYDKVVSQGLGVNGSTTRVHLVPEASDHGMLVGDLSATMFFPEVLRTK
jgi:hypothetical protein